MGIQKRARILLMDTENQQTMTKWWNRRYNGKISVVSASDGQVTEVQSAATEDSFDLSLVDIPHQAVLVYATIDGRSITEYDPRSMGGLQGIPGPSEIHR